MVRSGILSGRSLVEASRFTRGTGQENNIFACSYAVPVTTTKVFKSGGSQFVYIPREFQNEDDVVEIRRLGNAIVLEPRKGSWACLSESLDMFADVFKASLSVLMKRRSSPVHKPGKGHEAHPPHPFRP
jgi:antitoxin VapB